MTRSRWIPGRRMPAYEDRATTCTVCGEYADNRHAVYIATERRDVYDWVCTECEPYWTDTPDEEEGHAWYAWWI